MKHIKQEQPELADLLGQGSSLPSYYPGLDLESQHGDPDHPQNLLNCPLYHCTAILRISLKSTQHLLGNGRISNWTVGMVIWIATKNLITSISLSSIPPYPNYLYLVKILLMSMLNSKGKLSLKSRVKLMSVTL